MQGHTEASMDITVPLIYAVVLCTFTDSSQLQSILMVSGDMLIDCPFSIRSTYIYIYIYYIYSTMPYLH